jgi:aspartate aminotransferase
VDFSARLLEKVYVAVTLGEAFGTNDHVRMSYATSMEQLDKGLKRIHEFMTSL